MRENQAAKEEYSHTNGDWPTKIGTRVNTLREGDATCVTLHSGKTRQIMLI